MCFNFHLLSPSRLLMVFLSVFFFCFLRFRWFRFCFFFFNESDDFWHAMNTAGLVVYFAILIWCTQQFVTEKKNQTTIPFVHNYLGLESDLRLSCAIKSCAFKASQKLIRIMSHFRNMSIPHRIDRLTYK